ncbi:MAG TPA: hypothetical protein VFB12_17050 [Ktedonobacteraceae bacterium]|nr:hypothetical protein [Ktedonobacteraceae bacterium]
MSRAMLSLIVSCNYDPQADTLQVQIVRVDTGEKVRLQEGSFLLRCPLSEQRSPQRCQIRHAASGREAYIQIGPGLRNFIKDCLLDTNESSGHA